MIINGVEMQCARQSEQVNTPKKSELFVKNLILFNCQFCFNKFNKEFCYSNKVAKSIMGIIRKTKSIELLLHEFKTQTTAISTIELIKRLNSKLNKTTIYRVLENLEDDGILHSFIGQVGFKWYAICSNCTKSKHEDLHPHFECIDCGEIDCLKIEVIIPEIQNRKIFSSQILIQGTCEKCIN